MPTQTTVDAADEVVSILNAAGLAEGITFSRTFVPEFDPDDLSAGPKGSVYPAGLELSRETRAQDREDHGIEIGVGRKIANESTDIETQVNTVEEVVAELRKAANRTISTAADGDSLKFISIEVRLFIPELLRRRVALSVVRVVYRGWS
jgi:hypothetical protein